MTTKFLLISAANFSKLLSSLVFIKVSASNLGPEGIGLIGHFISFVSLIFAFSGGGISNGIITLTSKNKNDETLLQDLSDNFQSISLFCSLFISLLIFIFSKNISLLLFKSEEYFWSINILASAVLFFSYINFYQSFLNGLLKTYDFSLIQIFGNFLSIIISIILINSYGFNGVLIAFIFGFLSLIFPILIHYCYRKPVIFRKISLKKDILGSSFKYSFIFLMGALSVPLIEFIIREIIIRILGYADAGYWQAVNRISVAHFSFYVSFFTFYLLPRLKEVSREAQIKLLYLEYFKLILPIFVILSSGFYYFSNFFIPILLSDKFLFIADFLPYQFFGDFMKVIAYSLGMVAVSRALIWYILPLELIQFFLLICITTLFISNDASLVSVYRAYSISYVLYSFLMLIIFTKLIKK